MTTKIKQDWLSAIKKLQAVLQSTPTARARTEYLNAIIYAQKKLRS